MNFQVEVLLNFEKIELKEVEEILPNLELNVKKAKSELTEYVENVYLTSNERSKQSKLLLKEVNTLEKELKHLMQDMENFKMKQLADANCDIENHIVNLNRNNCFLNTTLQLYKFNKDLKDFDNLLKCGEFFNCMKIVIELENFPSQICNEPGIKFVEQIEFETSLKKEMLLMKLSDIFSKNIYIKHVNVNNYILQTSKEVKDLQQALKALHLNDSAISYLSDLTGQIWKHLVVPAVISVIQLDTKDDEYFNILEITIINSKNKSEYSKVFDDLEKIFQFLKSYFGLIIEDNMSTMKLIGDDIRDNLAELIIKQCLEDTIPATSEELKNYQTVIQKTAQFEKILKFCEIFDDTTNMLTEFVYKIDTHYINKKFKEYSQVSEKIMKKDLHDIKEVGTPYNPHNLNCTQGLSLCCVSKSAIEFTDFIGKIIPQDYSSSETFNKIICTIKTIVKSYGYLVPQYHSKLLETIPQQVAIFQNNCFYISHELTKINEMLISHSETAHYNLIEEAESLQQIGLECFTKYVNKTKDSLVIKGIEGPMLKSVAPEAEKSVRQCMRQQELLKTVWHKILPYQLYNKTIGDILDHMCQILITSVTSNEDISSEAAEQLIDIFKIVITRGPKLFSDAKEVCLFVPKWYKFNELNFILGATLIDIYDRWTDGKGPLALQFTAKEIKLLIRALFQNSERRATILAKI